MITIAVTLSEAPAGSLRALKKLMWGDSTYPDALWDTILVPFLQELGQCASGAAVAALAEKSVLACGRAFQQARQLPAAQEEYRMLAALTVTTNLQRTLVAIAEQAARCPPGAPLTLTLSRAWCGFLPARNRPRQKSTPLARSLARALACAPGEVAANCEDAMAKLRSDLRSGAVLKLEDLACYTRSAAGGGRPI